MNIKKEKEDALFDAFTEYWKNDWKNTRRSRTSGRIQIGDSKTYLIKSSASFNSSRAYIYGTHHWVVYKLNDEYDMSNFSMDFAMRRGWKEDYEIVEEYVEVVSGSKGKEDRSELSRMLSDCKKRKFEKLIVWELSRLGRSLSHLVNTLQEMKDSDVDLYSVREGIDTSTSMGKTMFGLIGVFSEFELEVRKDRVQRGIEHYRKTHKTWGRKKTIKTGNGKVFGKVSSPTDSCIEKKTIKTVNMTVFKKGSTERVY